MDPTFTVRKALERDGREHWVEVSIRFLPQRYAGSGLGETSTVQQFINNHVLAPLRDDLCILPWDAVTDVLKEGTGRLKAGGLAGAGGFRANVVGLEVSDGIAPDDAERLLREAGTQAAEDYFAAIDDGRVTLTQADVDREFAYLPETGDDPAYLLHALYPRPEGPPSRLIERIWDHLPDLVRDPYATFGWRVAKGPGDTGPRPDRA